MQDNIEIRLNIRTILKYIVLKESTQNSKNNLKESGSLVEEQNCEQHIDKELSNFSQEFKKLAMENKHPYVRYYLLNAIEELNKTIKSGRIIGAGLEEMF